MSFLNKIYNFDKNENYKEFLLSVGVPENHINLNSNPTYTLKKEGDQYIETIITPGENNRDVKFKDGVEFDDEAVPGTIGKSKFTVEGNVVTQSEVFNDVTVISRREFSGDKLVIVFSSNKSDCTARRYFTAA